MTKMGAILVAVVVTGCGGTDEIINSGSGKTIGGGSPNSAMSAGAWILDAFARPPSTSSAMPTGTATFRGSAVFSTDTEDSLSMAQNPNLISSVTVTASLQDGGLTANFNNFSTGGGLPVEGSIQSSLTSGNGFFSGTASGNLTIENGIVEYAGDIFGNFRGQDARFFTGDLQLDSSAGELNGIFATQR